MLFCRRTALVSPSLEVAYVFAVLPCQAHQIAVGERSMSVRAPHLASFGLGHRLLRASHIGLGAALARPAKVRPTSLRLMFAVQEFGATVQSARTRHLPAVSCLTEWNTHLAPTACAPRWSILIR